MIEKYSVVKFNHDKSDFAFYVVGITEDKKLILADFPRHVDPVEVTEVKFDLLSTEELISTHDSLQKTADVYRNEIRRRRYHVEKFKINSPYFADNFDVKPKGKNH